MNIGLTVCHNRISPCFSGVDLWILGEDQDITQNHAIDTQDWHALAWGQELMRRDVGCLLCSGIDHFLWGSLQGHGIDIVPNASGAPDEVLKQWRNGILVVPEQWPYGAKPGRCRRRGCDTSGKTRRGRC